MSTNNKKYKVFTTHSFRKIPQMDLLSEEQKRAIEVVGKVLPFKVNNYVLDNLIDWDNFETDPMFILTFPQKDMLKEPQYERVASLLYNNASPKVLKEEIYNIRMSLNPHPANQMEDNLPKIHGKILQGIQHKYDETVLFFPSQGQTCHAYCSFCFRWPQFTGIKELKFAMKETQLLIDYLQANPQVTDVLFTGGDPLIMKTKILENYIDALLQADLPNLTNIRIGTKALGYWPYRFFLDDDADDLLRLFERVRKAGKSLAFMAHFSHPVELQTPEAQLAIQRIISTGAQIRTQSPILNKINDNSTAWANMWREQIRLGCIPYYMFVARDTGAQEYFAVPIAESLRIFTEANNLLSGLAKTARGPVMSCGPGKVHVLGTLDIAGERYFALSFLQEREKTWGSKVFLAKYDEEAIWINELRSCFGEGEYFKENYLKQQLAELNASPVSDLKFPAL